MASEDLSEKRVMGGETYTRLKMEPAPEEDPAMPLPGAAAAEAPASRAMVVFSVLFYLVAAIVMIMVNKAVLNTISIPLFFLTCQLVIAVICLHICAVLGYFTLPVLQLQTIKNLVPLIACNCTGLIFNTYCLQFVDASFYQIARGLVLPFTVAFSFFLLSARPSLATLAAVGVVCIGFFFGVSAEHLTVSRIGVLLGVFSSVTTAVHAIVVKRSLKYCSGTMDLAYYNNLLSAVVMAPIIVFVGEWPMVSQMVNEGGEQFWNFVLGTLVTGLVGFLICIAGFLSIKVTSPVSHMISSAVRGVIQTFLGMWVFGDIITTGRASGIGFILLGSIWYTYSKSTETKPIALPPSPARSTSLASRFSTPRPDKSDSPYSSAHSKEGSLSTPVLRHPGSPVVGEEPVSPLLEKEKAY